VGGIVFLHHSSAEKDGSQHERRPNSCVGMRKAERRKLASLGTPQMQHNWVTLIPLGVVCQRCKEHTVRYEHKWHEPIWYPELNT
jgi:hypothetical protein